MAKCAKYIQLLRPHQWIKNSFVLLGVIFSHQFNDHSLLINAFIATFAFCFISSSVYIYNDLIDRKADGSHPTKKHRPIAAKKISPTIAVSIDITLIILGISLASLISTKVVYFILGYFALNIVYTHWLKNMVILDVFAICAGFMLRILTGTIGLNIPPSPWLLFCGLSLTLFLGFTKRRAEIYASPASGISRKVLKKYNAVFLDKMIGIMASCSIITYALYTMSPETEMAHHTKNLIYTVPFVIYGLFRYLFLLHNDAHQKGEDTAKDIFTDPPLLLSIAGWLIATFFALQLSS